MNHRFHDSEWAENYANTITGRRPERIKMFEHIVEEIRLLGEPTASIVELAAGPGLLANEILDALPEVRYLGLDYSEEMIRLAEQKTADHRTRCTFLKKDLRSESWEDILSGNHDALISNMALHDLGSAELVESIYQRAKEILKPGGLFLNAELVLAEDHQDEVQGGKFKVQRHQAVLNRLGYERVTVPLNFGQYACIQGYRQSA